MDGTLVKAWASMKSFQPKADAASPEDDEPGDPPTPDATPETKSSDSPTATGPMPSISHRHRNAEVDFKGEKRSNATHASTTDPDAGLYKKSPGTGAMLCFMGEMRPQKHRFCSIERAQPHADGEPLGPDRAGRPDPRPPLGRLLRNRLPGHGRSCRTQGRPGHDPSPFPRVNPATDAGG
jgi:hypothetical protein